MFIGTTIVNAWGLNKFNSESIKLKYSLFIPK